MPRKVAFMVNRGRAIATAVHNLLPMLSCSCHIKLGTACFQAGSASSDENLLGATGWHESPSKALWRTGLLTHDRDARASMCPQYRHAVTKTCKGWNISTGLLGGGIHGTPGRLAEIEACSHKNPEGNAIQETERRRAPKRLGLEERLLKHCDVNSFFCTSHLLETEHPNSTFGPAF